MAGKVMVKSDTHSGIKDRVSAALVAKHAPGGGNTSDYYGDPYVQDMFPDKVIHTMPGSANRGKMFASKYDANKSDMGLGDPKEVQQAYKPMAESSQGIVSEASSFTEAKGFDTKTKNIVVTVIKPGFNTSKGRFYTKKAISETGNIFAGAKMFANHATKAEDAARPEGRIQDWVASLGTPYLESDGSLKCKAKVHDADFAKKLEGLQEAGLLGEMGVSIRAAGLQTPGEVEGVKTSIVESFIAAKSVDFVTFPGAGGKVEMMESEGQHYFTVNELENVFQESESNDVDLIPIEVLVSRRPDLVAHIKESYNMEKTVEQLKIELAESQTKYAKLESDLAEATKAGKKAAVQAELTTRLSEAKLPEATDKRLRAQFAEATDIAGIKEAVIAESDYIKALGVTHKPGVRNMGATQESSATDETRIKNDYIAAQVRGGMTKEMAEASALNIGF